jgi:hypothetical protein
VRICHPGSSFKRSPEFLEAIWTTAYIKPSSAPDDASDDDIAVVTGSISWRDTGKRIIFPDQVLGTVPSSFSGPDGVLRNFPSGLAVSMQTMAPSKVGQLSPLT